MSSFKDCRPTISRSPRSAERVGVEPTSPFGSPVFETGAIANLLALPFQAGVAGIEPATFSLTGSRSAC